jgi:hypothetical protein
MNRLTRAAFLLAAMASLAKSARAEELGLAYEIHLGGFRAGSIELKVELAEAQYAVAASTRTRGLVDALVGFRSEAHSAGVRSPDAIRPLEHRADNRWRGESRQVRIFYRESGPIAAAEPPPELDDRDPVPAALTRSAVDPLTAALQAALDAQAGRACEGRLDVFDGRRRYALHFEDRRVEGDGMHCRLRLERIAGLSHDPWLPALQPIETAELWLARLRPWLPPIPLRLQAETAFGAAIVSLTALDGAPP